MISFFFAVAKVGLVRGDRKGWHTFVQLVTSGISDKNENKTCRFVVGHEATRRKEGERLAVFPSFKRFSVGASVFPFGATVGGFSFDQHAFSAERTGGANQDIAVQRLG